MPMIPVRKFNYQLMPGDVDRSVVIGAHLAGLLGLGYGLTDDMPQMGSSFDAGVIRAAGIVSANTRGSAQYDLAMKLYQDALADWELNSRRFAKPNQPPPPLVVTDANYDALEPGEGNTLRYGGTAYLTSAPGAFVPYVGGAYSGYDPAAVKLQADKAQAAANAAAADRLIADKVAVDKAKADADKIAASKLTPTPPVKSPGNVDKGPTPPVTVDDGLIFGMSTTTLLIVGGAAVALFLATRSK